MNGRLWTGSSTLTQLDCSLWRTLWTPGPHNSFGVSYFELHCNKLLLITDFSHTKEWHTVFNGTKEEGRKAIRSLFGPKNKWGYDCTGKSWFTLILEIFISDFCKTGPWSKFCKLDGDQSTLTNSKYKTISVDLPANSLWQTLRDEFPEAKVILVVRDDQKWINSLQNHLVVSINHASMLRLILGISLDFRKQSFRNRLPVVWSWVDETHH